MTQVSHILLKRIAQATALKDICNLLIRNSVRVSAYKYKLPETK